jgi:hypothetical protein
VGAIAEHDHFAEDHGGNAMGAREDAAKLHSL